MTYYVKGGSVYDNSSCKLYLYVDLNGYPDDNYETVTDADLENDDPYIRFGGTGGQKKVELGLFNNNRFEITDTEITIPSYDPTGKTDYSIATKKYVDDEIGGAGPYLENIVEDLTPQLGGYLDCNQKNITNVKYINILNDSPDDDLPLELFKISVLNGDWFLYKRDTVSNLFLESQYYGRKFIIGRLGATTWNAQFYIGNEQVNNYTRLYRLQLGDSGVLATKIIDDDSMATATATTLSTSESIKTYVDNNIKIIYGFFGGGNQIGMSNVIDYINVLTISGNATDKGDLTVARDGLAGGIRGLKYGFFTGGDIDGGYQNIIDFIDTNTSSGNAIDRGNLTVSRMYLAGVCSEDIGCSAGGFTGSYSDVIDYFNKKTTIGNAVDRGDLTVARMKLASVTTVLYGFYGGGFTGSYSDVIDYIDYGTQSCSSGKGTLTVARRYPTGVSCDAYGFFGGGYNGSMLNVIDYINATTTSGNALDKGTLTVARESAGGTSGNLYGFFGGGDTGSRSNIIDYINVTTTTGNASDKGDLTVTRSYLAGV